eukprot:7750463-Pyramimonas_sp.AAC.2
MRVLRIVVEKSAVECCVSEQHAPVHLADPGGAAGAIVVEDVPRVAPVALVLPYLLRELEP